MRINQVRAQFQAWRSAPDCLHGPVDNSDEIAMDHVQTTENACYINRLAGQQVYKNMDCDRHVR